MSLTFKQRIEDLAGTIPATADGEQFIKDGAHDVTNRMLVLAPDHADLFAKDVTIADGGTTVDNTHILGVHRDSTSCRQISSASRHSAVDSGSIYYATSEDPVYYVLNSKMYVKPTGGTTVKANIIAHGHPSNWDAGDSSIENFPEENYYQVILYAAMQVLHHRMIVAEMPTSTLTITAVPPAIPTLSTTSLNFVGTAPVYTTPTTTINGTNWATAYPNTVSAVSAALAKITTAVNQAATAADKFTNADTDSVFGDEDTFLTANSQLTRVKSALDQASSLVNGNDPSSTTDAYAAQSDEDIELVTSALNIVQTEVARANAELGHWVSVGDMRVKEAKIALEEAQGYIAEVQANLSPIAMQIQEYQTKVQDALNTFNKENTEYQAQLQVAIQDAQLEDAADSKKLSKYQAEIQDYQGKVGTEVQEFQANYQVDSQEAVTEYQWMAGQLGALKQQYEASFLQGLRAGGAQQ
tara:strand:+ start:371 stop:1777 length:1407 start_codon:yes stop_codon:yes gene_type:complete